MFSFLSSESDVGFMFIKTNLKSKSLFKIQLLHDTIKEYMISLSDKSDDEKETVIKQFQTKEKMKREYFIHKMISEESKKLLTQKSHCNSILKQSKITPDVINYKIRTNEKAIHFLKKMKTRSSNLKTEQVIEQLLKLFQSESSISIGITKMEYLDGFETIGIQSFPNQIYLKMACCLRIIHGLGYIHCDAHEWNFMINPKTNQVVILDFGEIQKKQKTKHPLQQELSKEKGGLCNFTQIDWLQKIPQNDIRKIWDLQTKQMIPLTNTKGRDLLKKYVKYYLQKGGDRKVATVHMINCNETDLISNVLTNQEQVFRLLKNVKYGDFIEDCSRSGYRMNGVYIVKNGENNKLYIDKLSTTFTDYGHIGYPFSVGEEFPIGYWQLAFDKNSTYYKGKNAYWHMTPQPEPVSKEIINKIQSEELVEGDNYCDVVYSWGTLRFPGNKKIVNFLLEKIKKNKCKKSVYFDLVYINNIPQTIAILNEWEQ